ncbi:APG9-domain-containing protein [Fomitiporia mediterranea MF3/22]|uniref:APG9-domain-containing protein n=1 Tax=Fomitiporia mediterranea (strain MF3/22) TaxID=694068 RepID=UPI0004409A5C|nr:APG9-domain-containing protein [Fomitiporia mediterranea MF3/22]EJD05712.1 APG9-domain-containing protein [Fomitiporia mediterranea MF3/22]
MLNPMSGRNYQGYLQANQSVLEEEDENDQDETLGETRSPFRSNSRARRVSWGESSRMKTIQHNVPGQLEAEHDDSSDGEVPQSFMIERTNHAKRQHTAGQPKGKGKQTAKHTSLQSGAQPILPVTNQDSLRLPPRPSEIDPPVNDEPQVQNARKQMRGLDAYERALWNWINVYDLDVFLQDVYRYYAGKGIFSIALARSLHLLTVGFTIFFSTFLLNCIDYSRIKPEGITRLSDVIVDRCVARLSGMTVIFFMFFGAYYTLQIVSYVFEIMRLVDMYRFYTYLLGVPDADIQTISWPEIVRRIESIREDNPVTALSSAAQVNPSSSMTAKLDAHDIANRIMREENYLIALFNKDLLDLRIPLPHVVANTFNADGRNGLTLSTALEHNLRICLMRFLFDSRGRVREVFLKERNRAALIKELRYRFIFMGILNAVLAPFIVLYLLMFYFFKYFEEYHKNPTSIGSRTYTLYARWKFREFNELPHVFSRRLDESYPLASMYIGQFPNEKLALVMRFISFIAGSFAAVLLLASVLDPELFTHFEITPHRTVLFYIGIFGSVLAVARGMIPEDNKIFDPELLMEDVIHYTHYMPDEWKGQLHSQKVHKDFGKLFDMKVMIFARELLSVIITPFVLCFSLPNSAPAIVDFFREFTVHVDSLGYVCSFAVFDFKRHGNVNFGAPTNAKDERFLSKEGKMEKSFLNFKAANPAWQPTDPSGSLYLSRMADFTYTSAGARRRQLGDGPAGHVRTLSAEQRLTERAQGYDRALRQSQDAALRRRGQPSRNSTETPISPQGPEVSVSPPDANVQTPITMMGEGLAESNINPFPSQIHQQGQSVTVEDTLRSNDLSREGEVHSELGESYVDGKMQRGRTNTLPSSSQRDESGPVEDGGMLGLLAQIYGTRGPGLL